MTEPAIRLVWRKIDELIPYEGNAKQHPQAQLDRLVNSFDEFGRIVPAGIDAAGNLIYGHGRILAARQRGDTEFPCIEIDGLSEIQRRAFVHADNLLAESPTDETILRGEMQALAAAGFDIRLTGFDPAGLKLGAEDEPEIVDDADLEPPEEPKSKRGQIYQLGRHRLMCGDSTDEVDVEILMDGATADMVFTDPPYNCNYGTIKHPKFKVREILNDNMDHGQFRDFCIDWLLNIKRFRRSCVYICAGQGMDGRIMFTVADNILHNSTTIIWNKDHFTLGRGKYQNKYEPIWFGWVEDGSDFIDDRTLSNVWDIKRPSASDLHPTMKPIELICTALSHNPRSKKVLDLFGGSGSTLIACEQTGRSCYMMELDPKYVDVIISRWENITGKKAVLVNG